MVDQAAGSYPRRICIGIEQNRIHMLLAVLHRHGGVNATSMDVYLNIVGGMRVQETAADLAIVIAVISSLRAQALPLDLVVFGEIGLAGEVRPVPGGEERLVEAHKQGYKQAIIPMANKPRKPIKGLRLFAINRLAEVIDILKQQL